MNTPINEHDSVVALIRDTNAAKFKVIANLGEDKYYIGQMFPDLILLDKESDTPVFIIEVKKNGGIAHCLQQWKSQVSIPATLYIIVPETDLANAKSIAQIIGLQTRFGAYTISENGNVTVRYE